MQLKVGKRYVCTDSHIQYVDIVQFDASQSTYKYSGRVTTRHGQVTYTYTSDGIFDITQHSSYDLVSEYQEHLDNLDETQKPSIFDVVKKMPWRFAEPLICRHTPADASAPVDKLSTDSAVKHDTGKLRLELLPFLALEEVARVMEFGARKYGDYNWMLGMHWTRIFGAGLRHTTKALMGEDRDEESGLLHTAHAACCLLFLTHYFLTGVGQDDRYKPYLAPETEILPLRPGIKYRLRNGMTAVLEYNSSFHSPEAWGKVIETDNAMGWNSAGSARYDGTVDEFDIVSIANKQA